MGMVRKAHPKQFKTVAEAMKALGYTDQKLADAVRCDRTWITRVRRGMKLKTLTTPIRIAKALNVPIEALAELDAA
jgi:transcriptional regulator with XRE-family HTH domain